MRKITGLFVGESGELIAQLENGQFCSVVHSDTACELPVWVKTPPEASEAARSLPAESPITLTRGELRIWAKDLAASLNRGEQVAYSSMTQVLASICKVLGE